MPVEHRKLKIGNLVSITVDNSHIVGVITEVCLYEEIFKILSSKAELKTFCTEIIENDTVTVISDIDDNNSVTI